MRRLGEAVAHTGGVLVVRCEEGFEPIFDEPVYDDSLDEVGRTVEFFGPVDRPYALVDTHDTGGDGDERLYLRD